MWAKPGSSLINQTNTRYRAQRQLTQIVVDDVHDLHMRTSDSCNTTSVARTQKTTEQQKQRTAADMRNSLTAAGSWLLSLKSTDTKILSATEVFLSIWPYWHFVQWSQVSEWNLILRHSYTSTITTSGETAHTPTLTALQWIFMFGGNLVHMVIFRGNVIHYYCKILRLLWPLVDIQKQTGTSSPFLH